MLQNVFRGCPLTSKRRRCLLLAHIPALNARSQVSLFNSTHQRKRPTSQPYSKQENNAPTQSAARANLNSVLVWRGEILRLFSKRFSHLWVWGAVKPVQVMHQINTNFFFTLSVTEKKRTCYMMHLQRGRAAVQVASALLVWADVGSKYFLSMLESPSIVYSMRLVTYFV
jgi:hypothetical protein